MQTTESQLSFQLKLKTILRWLPFINYLVAYQTKNACKTLNRYGLLFFLTWGFLLTSFSGIAKKLSTAELLNNIEQANHDSIRAKNYYQLAKNYLRVSEDSCRLYAQKALEYAKKCKHNFFIAETYSILGAREKYNGNYSEAIEFHLKALSYKEASKDTFGMSVSHNDIGIVYKNMGRFKEALPYYIKSHQFASAAKNMKGVSMTLSNIGTVYSALKNLDSARIFYDSALAVGRRINDSSCIVNALANLGEYYGAQNNHQKAMECFTQSLAIDQAFGDKYGMVLDYTNLASAYIGQKQFSEANDCLNKAEQLAKEEELNKELINVLHVKSNFYRQTGQLPMALTYLEKAQDLKDSLLNEETNNQVSELNTKYETAKKENKIAQQQNQLQKQQFLLIGGIILLMLLGLAAYYRYQKLKAHEEIKIKEVIHEQQVMATHSVLEAEEKERQRIASELHDGVGQLMTAAKMNLGALESDLNLKDENKKQAFQRIMDLITESGKEVRDVAHNLMPNILLKKGLSNAVQEFLNKIDNKVIKVNLHAEGLNDKIDNNVEAVLYRVIQECVNNVIKHAKADHLDISLTNDAEGIAVTIEDNGIGFNPDKERKQNSIGLDNIKSRVEYLKGHVDIDSSPGKGTLIAIFIPLHK